MASKSTPSDLTATGLATGQTTPEGGGGDQTGQGGEAGAAHSASDNFVQRKLFPVVEAQLPSRLGLSRDVIRTLREEILIKGRHWVKVHRDILLNEEAVALLLKAHAALKTAATLPSQPHAKNVAPREASERPEPIKSGPPLVALRVKRLLPVNHKMLQAILPSDPATTLHVRVQSTQNYRPGMTIYAYRVSATLYAVHGRAPSYPGEKVYRDEP
jgi:hypothetical protein